MLSLHHVRSPFISLVVVAICALIFTAGITRGSSAPADVEYHGQLEHELTPNTEDLEDVVFKPFSELSKVKLAKPPSAGARVTAARLYHPLLQKQAIFALLVEPEDDAPYLLADVNLDHRLDEGERFPLTPASDNDPDVLQATLKLPLKAKLFQEYPLLVQYLRHVQSDELKEGERLVVQSKEAFARGWVEIQNHQTLVEYDFNPQTRKISAMNGWQGIDADGDGEIDMDRFSPEAAEAHDETVVFRVGDHYVSTKRVDVENAEIVLREHPASDYKRVELRIGGEVPDFTFSDFNGKKRKLSEFRGKYVLLDFWAAWCGPCRRELPYQKAAYTRFQARGFEILGLDNDEDVIRVKAWLRQNNLNWTQATRDSIHDLEIRYRIRSFPTALLIGPDGKVISLGQRSKQQPGLRGAELLATLDQVLPH